MASWRGLSQPLRLGMTEVVGKLCATSVWACSRYGSYAMVSFQGARERQPFAANGHLPYGYSIGSEATVRLVHFFAGLFCNGLPISISNVRGQVGMNHQATLDSKPNLSKSAHPATFNTAHSPTNHSANLPTWSNVTGHASFATSIIRSEEVRRPSQRPVQLPYYHGGARWKPY